MKKGLKGLLICLILTLVIGTIAYADNAQKSKLALDMIVIIDESGSMSASPVADSVPSGVISRFSPTMMQPNRCFVAIGRSP